MIGYYTNVLHLNETLGCSPHTYNPYLPIVVKTSLYNLYVQNIMPSLVFNHSLPNIPYFICNTATLRYSLYAGRVTVNDIFSIDPFSDDIMYYPSLSGSVLLALLENIGSFTVQNLHRTPYFSSHETLDVSRPAFTHTLLEVNTDLVYDIVCAFYDTATITQVLESLYPGQNFDAIPYPTQYTTTSAIGSFVMAFFPCTPECSC